ncbi:MAG: MarR family winged helix-turn-helix transcriptional regulator [Candidatus Saccharibacteria bacterium]
MEDFTTFVCFTMRTAMKKLDKFLAARLEAYGVSVPQSFVLFCLLEDDGITLKEIGNRAQIDSSSMTVLVDKLENEGLVERKLDPQDRRAIRVFLTDKGRDLGTKVLAVGAEFNQYIRNNLADVEQPFFKGLEMVSNAME